MEKTSTDELWRMLDERGVVYSIEPAKRNTAWIHNGWWHNAKIEPWSESTCKVTLYDITPEQAIAATLGNGTCKMEYIDTYEYPDGEEDYLCKCSKCGRKSWEPAHNLPKFCGGCGRKVER